LHLCTKEANYFQGINEEKHVAMTLVGLLDSNIIIICIYRLGGNFDVF
jgi:hypothetical protein